MKVSKKVMKKLERRGRGHAEIIKRLKSKSNISPESAYKAPGSRNLHKQG